MGVLQDRFQRIALDMRVLIVSSFKPSLEGNIAPFVKEQAEAIDQQGVECLYYLVRGKGILGYLRELPSLRKRICEVKPDVVHAHFGLCGLLANLQRKVPVVTTYHGSDINVPSIRRFSKIAIRLSKHNIFVSRRLAEIAKPKKNSFSIIPCGINLEDYPIVDKLVARREMGLNPDKKYVLFAGAFDNPVKNPQLAKDAVRLLPDVELLELKGYSRHQVALLMNAADCFLMTSHTEGSPQVIKEAMACGCPIVSVDVGDVVEIIKGENCCYWVDRTPQRIADGLNSVYNLCQRANGRQHIIELGLTNYAIVRQIVEIYESLI